MPYLCNSQKLKPRRQTLRNNMPQPEQILWYYLKGKNLAGYKFRRQYSIGNYILDFYCPELRLAIEIDGDSHFVDCRAINYDQKREKFLTEQNVKVIHFINSDVINNIDAVIGKISEYLFKLLPPLAPPAPGGEQKV